MTKRARLKKMKARIHDPSECEDCGGTGVVRGREQWKKNGCANCVVGNSVVMISPRDLLWLIKQAGG